MPQSLQSRSTLNFIPACVFSILISSPVFAQPDRGSESLADEVERYAAEIAQLGGSYDESSAEILHRMAQIYIELGRFDDAINAYRESLQALRINEGLASEAQLDVIKEFNVLLLEQGEWDELDTNNHLAAEINSRLYGFTDARYINAATALAGWKIRAYQSGVYEPRGNRSIQEAANVYRTLLRHLPPAQLQSREAEFLSAQGLAYYYSARYVASLPLNEFQGVSLQNFAQTCTPTVLSVDPGTQPSSAACQTNQSDPELFASQQREKNNQVRGHLGNMRQSFQEAIEAVEADPSATIREYVQAVLNYGDANLLAQDYARARSQYALAYELLSVNDELIELRNELLDRPAKALQGILNDFTFDQQFRNNVSLGTISFDVSERGEIENINIGARDGELDRESLGVIAMKLDQSVYRPRVVDGRPVRSRIELSTSEL